MEASGHCRSTSTKDDCNSRREILSLIVPKIRPDLPAQVIQTMSANHGITVLPKTDEFGTATARMDGPEGTSAVRLCIGEDVARVDSSSGECTARCARGHQDP